MRTLGILVVQTDWHPGAPVIIDKTTYQHHQDAFQPGTRFLVYVREPVDAIIAEAEETGAIFRSESGAEAAALHGTKAASAHAQQPTPIATADSALIGGGIDQRTFEIPYRVVRSRMNVPPIPLGAIRARLGSDFSVFDEEWIPLNEEQYNTLTEEWERNKS